jgi:hypothetical protein
MTRIERITPNGHKVVVFSPRRYTKRTLFNRVLKELKAREFKPINWFEMVLLELKERNKKAPKDYYTGEPKYNGKMYEMRWVYYSNLRIKNLGRFSICDYESHLKNEEPIVVWAFDKVEKKYPFQKDATHTKWRDALRDKRLQRFLNSGGAYGCESFERRVNDILQRKIPVNEMKNVPKENNFKMYKIRYEIGTMKYNTSRLSYYSVLNIKRWDKNTKKTSNKGLKADTTYSWTDGFGRGGWTFGGLDASNMEDICLKNGFKKEKGKKYQYGDYAEWYLSI